MQHGRWDIIKWGHAQGFAIPSDIDQYILMDGDLDMYYWARDNGFHVHVWSILYDDSVVVQEVYCSVIICIQLVLLHVSCAVKVRAITDPVMRNL